MQDLISIILPVYNGERYLAEAIQSCLDQSHKNLELIIVNDASTDKSLQIAERFAVDDKRITIITNTPNLNLPRSLNVGHKAAKGNYMTWLSDDNIFDKCALEILLEELKNSTSDLVFSNFDKIDKDGNSIGSYNYTAGKSILLDNIVGASFLYRKSLYDNVGGYNPNLHTIEDYDFWLQASRYSTFTHIPKSLYNYRVHDNSLTGELQDVNSKKRIDFGNRLLSSYESYFNALQVEKSQCKARIFKALHLGEFIEVHSVYEQFGNLQALFENTPEGTEISNVLSEVKDRLLLNVHNYKKNQNLKTLFSILRYDSSALTRHNSRRLIKIMFKCLFE